MINLNLNRPPDRQLQFATPSGFEPPAKVAKTARSQSPSSASLASRTEEMPRVTKNLAPLHLYPTEQLKLLRKWSNTLLEVLNGQDPTCPLELENEISLQELRNKVNLVPKEMHPNIIKIINKQVQSFNQIISERDQPYSSANPAHQEFMDKVLSRLNAFHKASIRYKFPLPLRLQRLSSSFRHCQTYDTAARIKRHLDAFDNLLFWKKIGVFNTHFKHINSFLDAYSEIEKPTLFMLENFDLSGLGLTSIPSDLLTRYSIKALDLSNNYITNVPEEIGKKTSLETLNLASNNISSLPETFSKLKSLQALDLSNNMLTFLPKDFGNLQSLQQLRLAGNEVRILPESFRALKKLSFFDLADSFSRELPIHGAKSKEKTCEKFDGVKTQVLNWNGYT